MAVYEPIAQILREAAEVFENEQSPRGYDDVAPLTQHEETQHELWETTQSESFEFFDPDRPLSQQHGDIAPQLHLPPTGKVAFNVRGTTIHAAFHIRANQKLQDYKPLSYDTLNTY